MSEEIEYPSKERERAKVNVKVSAEVNTYLHDLYNQIQYEFCEQYEDEIKDLQQKVKQLENIRKETIEYVLKNKLYKFKYDDEELFEITTDKKAKDDLLNILNKGDNKNKIKGEKYE